MVYAVASILTIIGMTQMPKILNKFGNRRTILTFATLTFLALLFLALGDNKFFAIIGFVLYFTSSFLIVMNLDIFVEDYTQNVSVGKWRGIYITMTSLSWVIAQSISGTVIAKSSYDGIYLLASLFIFLFVLIFILLLREFKDPHYKSVPILNTIKFIIHDKKVSKIYLLNFILKFFYAWMIVYTPIYLHEQIGFSWQTMGSLFTIMLLPFVLVTFPLGRLSDKIGEKKILNTAFVIIILATLLIPFIKEANFLLFAIVLFASRIGAASIEIMTESYFFKIEKEEDADVLSFFRNTAPLSFIIAPLLAIPILLFVPNFSFLFFILGAILLSGLYISLKLKDVK